MRVAVVEPECSAVFHSAAPGFSVKVLSAKAQKLRCHGCEHADARCEERNF